MVQGGDTLVGNEWIHFNQVYFKFSINQDGVYRIPESVLQSAGISGPSATGANFRLFNMGGQVPLYVTTNDPFGNNDYIEFYGYRNRSELDRFLFLDPQTDLLNPDYSLYTDKNVYYLTTEGDEPPVRVTNLLNDLSSSPPAESYILHREIVTYHTTFNDPYYPVSDGGAVTYSSFMHGEGFAKAAETNSSTQISASNRFLSGPDAKLHLRFTSTNYGTHSFVVKLNNQVLDTLYALNIEIKDSTYIIPMSLLTDDNQLTVTSLNASSRHAVVVVELTYPQQPDLNLLPQSSFILSGKTGKQHFILNGTSLQGVPSIVYSHDGRYRLVAAIAGVSQIEFVWPESLSDTQLDVTEPITGIKEINNLEEKIFTDYSSDNTEYIIITHPDLMDIGAGSAYVQYRISPTGGGYRANAYSILDIYDQFGYGIEKHPQAIRNFVEYFHRNWSSAKMILIVGRAVDYIRSRDEGGAWEPFFFVPTFGRPGSDQLLAATLWDLVPRYPIGRLAAINTQQIATYLQKVKEYDAAQYGDQTIESKAWIKNVIHIGGGKTAEEQNDFKLELAALGDELTHSDFGAKVSFFQKESTDIVGESKFKQLENLLHQGSTIINYLGHSSTSTFEFNINDPSEWNNKNRYPIFSAMGCSAGAIHGTVYSLSDRFIQLPDEGAIAFVSGSGSQFPQSLIQWAHPWYQYIGGLGYEGTLGESILVGLRNVGTFVHADSDASNPYRFLLEQQTLQGDPALRFHPLPGPDYVVDRSSVSFNPQVLNTKLDSFDVSFNINNIGRNLHQNVSFRIDIKWPDGQIINVKQGQVESVTFETPIHIRLPLNTGNKAGSFRLLISLDPSNLLAELPAPAAEENNELTDNLGSIGIPFIVVDNVISAVYPPDFAIVNTTTPELIATSSNSFIKQQDIVMELDTTALFNSPLKIREHFPDHSATLKWSPQFNYVAGKVYYWRVSTDSVSAEQTYLWSRRSFLYKPGSLNGWNQSHFYQFTDDRLTHLVADSANYEFRFGRKSKNFRMVNRYHNVDLALVPLFYEDGVFNAKLSSAFRNQDVTGFVVAIDSVTGRYMMNPAGGIYGSVGLNQPMEGFAYNLKDPVSRQNMINLVENIIPSGYYVFFYTYQHQGFPDYEPQEWAEDEINFGKSIFSVIEHQVPSSMIRTLASTGSKPYIVLFQKDRKPIEEQIAQNFDDVISISFDGGASQKSGVFTTNLIGPSSKWYSIEQEIETLLDTAGQNILSAWALSKDLSDTLWISHDLNNTQEPINSVDAKLYPFMQLSLMTGDSSSYMPSDIHYWRVYYEGYPEFIINPDEGFVFEADTLFQGTPMKLSTFVENLSPYDADSIPVSLRIISVDNSTQEFIYIIPHLPAHANAPVAFQESTEQLSGDYQVLLDVNAGNKINELNYSNNLGYLPMYVEGDRLNPILDVTFDGHHILDGDLVSSRPVIAIQLHDENQFLRLDDTSSFAIFLQYPSQYEPKRISFSEDWVHFIPASSTGQNNASVELTPELYEDGIYELRVKAKDASGNASGDNDFFIRFEVINAESVSYLYNYPNPFSTSTKFVYTLTGNGAPPYYKIQIMSLSGRIVREITQQELGPLTVGTHMTDFVWDGTDESGDKLASGTYLYRMIVKDQDLEDFDHYDAQGDKTYFKKGWGKLVIIR
jgi:hypothetical protein